jgi:tetratricopeptide (TPR) repeat protein
MASPSKEFCPEEKLGRALKSMERDDNDALLAIEDLLASYRRDPRLHFLRGSVLASLKRYDEAMRAMQQAIDITPDFAIARFQLGLLQLTSGLAAPALSTWGPLALLPDDHYLSFFVRGLQHMIRDEFDKAADLLRNGIDKNSENEPLNRDMRMLIERMPDAAEAKQDASTSSTHFLLELLRPKGRAN